MKLLNRTTLNYLIYSVIVLLVVTPVFYLVINRLFIEDVDEALLLQKKEIEMRIQKIKSETDVLVWADLDGDVKIEASQGKIYKDSIFYLAQYDSLASQMEPYRVLSSTVWVDGNKPYHLIARISLVESEDLIKAIALTQAIVLIILLAGLLLINWRVSTRIWKPFYDTLEKLENFEVDKTPQLLLGTSSVKEFVDLNNAIKRLADRNYKSYLSQKEFTENAAHEMQSPLAVFQSKLELLMQTKNLSEDQAQLMISMTDATSRLSKLNKALLLLSKIDNNQFIETESVNIPRLTNKLVDIFNKQAALRGIQIKTDFKNDLEISFNHTLIDILLSNLLSNAIRYNFEKGIITITISNRKWEIGNTGKPLTIPPAKIYDRFQKGDAGQTSTGLGLAIVRKICDTSGATIEYTYQNNCHFFTLGF
jgi:signal transduction histidine kinase